MAKEEKVLVVAASLQAGEAGDERVKVVKVCVSQLGVFMMSFFKAKLKFHPLGCAFICST